MITMKQLKEQERIAYINGDYEKLNLIAELLEARLEINHLEEQIYELEEERNAFL